MAKMYTCDEVAERYKVKVITVWDWIRQRKLNAIKLGREYRICKIPKRSRGQGSDISRNNGYIRAHEDGTVRHTVCEEINLRKT